MIRSLVLGCGAVVVFLVGAGEVPNQVRLPVSTVVAGAVVTQSFGCTAVVIEPVDPSCPTHHTHSGIDLAAPAGTEVHAATSGLVSTGFDAAGAGNFVEVWYDGHVRVLYCHLSAFAVRTGEGVVAGQLIGYVGATGLATGPHVHLQVDVDGVPVDPVTYLGS